MRHHGNHLANIANLSLQKLKCLPPQEKGLAFMGQAEGAEGGKGRTRRGSEGVEWSVRIEE